MPSFDFRGTRYNNPVELALDVIGGKWKMPILWRLQDGVRRHGELRRSLSGITAKMLTQQLRELEADGMLTRTVHAQVPPRVDYAITDLGRTALVPIQALREWGTLFLREQSGTAHPPTEFSPMPPAPVA